MKAAHTTIQRICALIAIFNNFVLILLIIYKSHRKIGKYKFLMIYISIFEILYAILDALTVPEIFSRRCSFIVVIQAEQSYLPLSFLLYADVIFCVFFGISMAIFAVHFIYRYLVVSENNYLKSHDNQVIISLLTIPILFGFFWFWVTYYFISPFEEANEFLKENLLNENFVNLSDVTYMGPLFWPQDSNGNLHLHIKSFIGIVIMTVAILISFFLIFYFGVKCYTKTKILMASASQSSSLKSLESQLFYALVFQTIIPVALMHIPASIGFAAAFLNVSIEFTGKLTSVTICLYPVLDPLPNFFIIRSYRDAICEFFRKLKLFLMCQKDTRVGIAPTNMSELYSSNSRVSVAM